MACTPLNIQAGPFITNSPWLSAPSAAFDGKTLTLTTGGPNPGLSVVQGARNFFHPRLLNRTIHYQVLGNKYLVILDVEAGVGASTRTVSVLDFATWNSVSILTVNASSNA
ncbi:hypothetical protein, partial [Streptomyces sp.]|uniref:hypothetical protein n=1 Tax=Streptomyces sp. TaxID=1931 RepID=UPI002F40D236